MQLLDLYVLNLCLGRFLKIYPSTINYDLNKPNRIRFEIQKLTPVIVETHLG